MKKILIYDIFSNVMLELVVWMIYLQSQGWSLVEIGLLEGLFTACQVIFELPSGIISDNIGHKKTLIIGEILCIFYLFGYFFHSHFVIYVCFILFALGLSLLSGTDVSILYDSIPKHEKKEYLKYAGIFNTYSILAIATGNMLGGWLAGYSWPLLFISGIVLRCLALIAAIGIDDTTFKTTNKSDSLSKKSFIKKDFFSLIWSFYKNNWLFKRLLTTICFADAAVTLSYQYGPIILNKINLSTPWISTIFGIISLLGALLSFKIYDFTKKVSENKLVLYILLTSLFFSFLIISDYKPFILVGLIVVNILFEAWIILLESNVQHIATDQIRATVLSTINLFSSFLLTIGSLMISLLSKSYQVTTIVGGLCSLLFVIAIVNYLPYYSNKTKGP
ncbi:MFS transporter [Dellaglioa sp. BT-FLS60]